MLQRTGMALHKYHNCGHQLHYCQPSAGLPQATGGSQLSTQPSAPRVAAPKFLGGRSPSPTRPARPRDGWTGVSQSPADVSRLPLCSASGEGIRGAVLHAIVSLNSTGAISAKGPNFAGYFLIAVTVCNAEVVHQLKSCPPPPHPSSWASQ